MNEIWKIRHKTAMQGNRSSRTNVTSVSPGSIHRGWKVLYCPGLSPPRLSNVNLTWCWGDPDLQKAQISLTRRSQKPPNANTDGQISARTVPGVMRFASKIDLDLDNTARKTIPKTEIAVQKWQRSGDCRSREVGGGGGGGRRKWACFLSQYFGFWFRGFLHPPDLPPEGLMWLSPDGTSVKLLSQS